VAAARPGVGYVDMHMRGEPRTMQQEPHYDEVVTEVCDFLVERASAARDAGVEEVWIDPGIGFGKTFAHNLSLLNHLGVFVETGFPVLVGASRKGFLRHLTGAGDDMNDAIEGSLAAAVTAMAAGVQMVRVHDVAATVQAARLVGEEASAA
jgi:dihydropteroate synthase